MNGEFQTKHKRTLPDFFLKYFSPAQRWKKTDPVEPMIKLVNYIRPSKLNDPVSLKPLLKILKENPPYLVELRKYLLQLFKNRSFTEMMMDVGIISHDSFGKEFRRKLTDLILPETSDSKKLRYIFSQVFYDKKDRAWIYSISRDQLIELLQILNFPPIESSFEENGTLWQIYYSTMVISLRSSGAALEKDIIRLAPQYAKKNSPFLALYREIEDLWEKSSKSGELKSQEDDDYKQITVLLNQCHDYLNRAYKGSETFGISLQTNKDINRINEQLDRIELILPLLAKEQDNVSQVKLMNLFYILMDIHSKRKKLGKFISDSTRLLAYEISSHKAKTGEKYITQTKGEYWGMLKAALGGGLIVGILCIIKVLLGKVETSDFGHAFLYSMNYSLGFIAIYILGFTLATKQPAMTASTLVNLIERGIHLDVKAKYRYPEFAQYFAQLFRTQFIAFVGNVAMAFPVALLGAYIIYLITGNDAMETKHPVLLKDLSPIHSPAIFHAAIAGVFLFLSGIISGDVANRNKFYNISKRLEDNPALKMSLGHSRAKKLSQWYSRKWPGIMSNFWFGIFMGSAAPLGAFLGLNLDVRHITFAAGNFGLGLFGANWQVAQGIIFWSILGIGIIGFVNFMVSFIMSLILAFKSKNVPASELRPLFLSVFQEFKSKPWTFFFPIGIQIKEEKEVKKAAYSGKKKSIDDMETTYENKNQ